MNIHAKKITGLLLALLLASSLAACGTSAQRNPILPEDRDDAFIPVPDYTDFVQDLQKENPHTIGWLSIPGTEIDDVVLWYPENNSYYERRSFEQEYSFNGVYYADYRSEFGSGQRDGMGINTCIYGHTLSDDPGHEEYPLKFGTLHNFRDPDFARQTPYIFFSTQRESMAYEIIAVFIANADNPELPYNRNDIPAEEFVTMIEQEIYPRSLYHYGIEITPEDRFLTLSTCIQRLEDGTRYPLRGSQMRFAVIARLLDSDVRLKSDVDFVINENLQLDPDGSWQLV